MRKKRSIIWKTEKDIIENVVSKSTSFSDVLKELGISNVGGNIATLKRRLLHDAIPFGHIPQGRGSNSNNLRGGMKPPPLEDVLVENSTYSRSSIKRRLIAGGLLENKCCECGQLPNWNGKKLVMILDHCNGTRNDNRLENLRLLCPNCNSQTETFAGKRKKYFTG